jgi:hypothetical protein
MAQSVDKNLLNFLWKKHLNPQWRRLKAWNPHQKMKKERNKVKAVITQKIVNDRI